MRGPGKTNRAARALGVECVLRAPETHDDSCKTLDIRTNNISSTCRVSSSNVCTYLGIVFSIPGGGAMVFRSRRRSRLTVATMIWRVLRHGAFGSSDLGQRSGNGTCVVGKHIPGAPIDQFSRCCPVSTVQFPPAGSSSLSL